jgi:hypothetical protein
LSSRETVVRREGVHARFEPRRPDMKYALLIYEDEQMWRRMPPSGIGQMMDGYRRFGEEHGERIQAGDALQAVGTATSVRVRDGERLLTDGPFAETAEQLGGFYVVEADSLDQALDMAAQIPGAATGVVEVRPVQEFTQDGQPVEGAATQAAG